MKTIAFHSNQLSVTGTEVALYDYAHYNETLLGNRSVIVHNRLNPNNHPDALAKFANRFEVLGYDHIEQLDEVLQQGNAELMYAIKAGKRDGVVSKRVPTMVHAVFPTAPWQVHGQSFAFISEWLSEECSNGIIPTVPHIVSLPSSELNEYADRERLGIPENALVFGCYGGSGSFNVPYAIEAVCKVLNNREDVYFIFMNITPFLKHPRAVFLPGTTEHLSKVRFINTCDAMLHARLQGESFGLACGEFAVKNKPVVTYSGSKHKHHHWVLKEKGFYYHDTSSLIRIIEGMDRLTLKENNWDVYTPLYNAERVIGLFDRHLINPALKNQEAKQYLNLTSSSYVSYLALKLKMRLAHR